MPQAIDTHRLRLVPLSVADAATMLDGGVPAGARWAEGYPADSTLIAAAIVVTSAREGRDLGPWAIFQVLRDGVVVGGMGFIEGPDATGAVRIGFSETAQARAAGCAAEGLTALIAYAREHGATLVRAEAGHPRLAEVFAAAGMRATGEDDGVVHFEA